MAPLLSKPINLTTNWISPIDQGEVTGGKTFQRVSTHVNKTFFIADLGCTYVAPIFV